jgi:DNA-binding transcriptional LysR family regulator
MDGKFLDLNLLRVLRVLLQELSVTRAAERLHLSQPAVSASLKRLRQSFDDPLFHPARRGITPTPRALELAEKVERILQEAESLTAPAHFDPRTEPTRFVIGANDFGLFSVVAPLLERIHRVSPQTELIVKRLSQDIGRQLAHGEMDVAITLMSTPVSGARVRPLFRETFTAIVRKGHPCLDRRLDLDEFCALPQVRVSAADARQADPIDEALTELGRTRRVVVTIPSFFSLPQLLPNSEMIAVAPTRLARHFGGTLTSTTLPLHVSGFTMNMTWDSRTQESESHKWLRREMEAVASDAGQVGGGPNSGAGVSLP